MSPQENENALPEFARREFPGIDYTALLDELAQDYVERSWRGSLYAMPKREERSLLAERDRGDTEAPEALAREHLGLGALVARSYRGNDRSDAELTIQAASVIREAAYYFVPSNGDRFADYVVVLVDERLANPEQLVVDETETPDILGILGEQEAAAEAEVSSLRSMGEPAEPSVSEDETETPDLIGVLDEQQTAATTEISDLEVLFARDRIELDPLWDLHSRSLSQAFRDSEATGIYSDD